MKARIGEQINMIFYISDIHFNDQRVFDKCSRPFKNLEEYKEKIILNWNRKVKADDIVYVLGDIAEDSYEEVIDIFKNLNGIKHFIVGNHDEKLLPIIKKAFLSGAVVTVCSQCPSGTVVLGAYETSAALKAAGAVSGRDMTTEAAVAKLYHLFSLNMPIDEIKQKMEMDLRGELTCTIEPSEKISN